MRGNLPKHKLKLNETLTAAPHSQRIPNGYIMKEALFVCSTVCHSQCCVVRRSLLRPSAIRPRSAHAHTHSRIQSENRNKCALYQMCDGDDEIICLNFAGDVRRPRQTVCVTDKMPFQCRLPSISAGLNTYNFSTLTGTFTLAFGLCTSPKQRTCT